MGAGPGWRARLEAVLTLARISNSPTVLSNVLAGAALGGAAALDSRLGVVALAMVLMYTAGMILNDVCDFAWDRRERPTRPLPAGLVGRRGAAVAAIALFGLAVALLATLGIAALICGLVLVGLIVLYDAWHKENPLSPLIMALCRLMVYVTAFLAFSEAPMLALAAAGVMLVVYMTALTAIARDETRASVRGRWPLALLFLPALFYGPQAGWVGLGLAVAQAGWVVYSLSHALRASGRDIGRSIGHLIAGISLLDALVLVSAGAPGWALLALAAFSLTLLFQRYIQGT